MYYFNNIWLYNYAQMVADILKSEEPLAFFKGVWRYRWVGQTYLPVLHWFDRGLQGLRGEALRASAWHYRAMVSMTIQQFQRMFAADTKLHNGKQNDYYDHTIAHKETVWGRRVLSVADKFKHVPLEMIPYFVTCHVNSHTVPPTTSDAVQSIGLPGDPVPMCQAEAGIFVQDDVPDYSPMFITSNEVRRFQLRAPTLRDWFFNKPLYAMPQPMQFDDPLRQKRCAKEIEGAWKFVEEMTGVPFNWDQLVKNLEAQNELQRFEWGESGMLPRTPTTIPSTASRRRSTASTSRSTGKTSSGMRSMPASARSWSAACGTRP